MLSNIAFIAITALAIATGVESKWALSNGTTFKPSIGKLNPNPSPNVPDDIFNQLQLSRNAVGRLNLLNSQGNPDLWKFNFNPTLNSSFASRGAGGLAVLADRSNFPALVGTGVSMAMGFLEPCGLNAAHFHPRATQLVVVASGGPLTAGAIWQNAAPSQQFTTKVHAWEAIALPQGSIHYVFNDNCHQTITVNAFGSEDPWILNIAPSLFKLNADILEGTLGFPEELNGGTPKEFLDNIPPSYVLGSKACLKRCGIDPKSRYAP